MSRYSHRYNNDNLLDAAVAWKKTCLVQDGSLFSDKSLWTLEHLEELDRCFTQNPIEGGDSFVHKLSLQLADTSVDAIQLMAELNWLLVLFSCNIKPDTKRRMVKEIWEFSKEPFPDTARFIDDQSLRGIGSTGVGFNTHRWRELVFLIDLLRSFKSLTTEQQHRQINDPWLFADWLASVPREGTRQLPHILKYLLFPDSFEHISISTDKRKILTAFENLSQHQINQLSNLEVDQQLLVLRKRLEKEYGAEVDFYDAQWLEQWRPSPSTWLISWDPRHHKWESYQDDRSQIAAGKNIESKQWLASTQVREGDTVYLMRTGEKPQKLIACGNITSKPYEIESHDSLHDTNSEPTHYVDIILTDLRDPDTDDCVSVEKLQADTSDDQTRPANEPITKIMPRSANLAAKLWEQLTPVEISHTEPKTAKQQAIQIAQPVNTIFYGPPGTGKTHRLQNLMKEYENQTNQASSGECLGDKACAKRHMMVTFHQSYGYEDFVEGIRPQTTNGSISYEVRDGLFKAFCRRASQDPKQRYALFIDEINRGNISRIFGELITLIEADKRAWWDNEGQLVDGIELVLPYSGERFGVPKNLDIYATMNTADRSIALMDAALRRRFHFQELMPDPELIPGSHRNGEIPDGEGGVLDLRALLKAINLRLRYLLHRDQTFGHTYFIEIKDLEALRRVMVYDIIPMLAEYFYDDWRQIQRVLADDSVDSTAELQLITTTPLNPAKLFPGSDELLPERPDYRVKAPEEISADAIKKIYESLESEA